MKKIYFILALSFGMLLSSNAQISTSSLKNTAKKVSTATGLDVNAVSEKIMSKLTTALTLTKDQQPKVLATVTNFLKSKSEILALAGSDKSKYNTQLNALTTDLTSKLKPILSASQYTKFLGLKPTTNTASNVLSQLFYWRRKTYCKHQKLTHNFKQRAVLNIKEQLFVLLIAEKKHKKQSSLPILFLLFLAFYALKSAYLITKCAVIFNLLHKYQNIVYFCALYPVKT